MEYLLSLAANLFSVGGLVLGLIIAEGALAVGAGVTVTALGVKINKRKKEIAARQAKPEQPEESPIDETPMPEPIEEVIEEPIEEVVEEPIEEVAEEPVEEVIPEPVEEEPLPEPVQMESYQPVNDSWENVDKQFNKYSSTHDADVAELRRHLEESRKEIGRETYFPSGDGQTWSQVKEYNGAVMPIVAVAGSDDENDDGDDEPKPAADDE